MDPYKSVTLDSVQINGTKWFHLVRRCDSGLRRHSLGYFTPVVLNVDFRDSLGSFRWGQNGPLEVCITSGIQMKPNGTVLYTLGVKERMKCEHLKTTALETLSWSV